MFRTAARLAAASAVLLAVAAPSAGATGLHVAAGDLNDPVATTYELENVLISSATPAPRYLKITLKDALISSAR